MATVRIGCDERGAVYVEFLVAFVPVFVTFLLLCQLALIAAARIVVQHSAYRAVRSAVVVLEDDPKHYGGAARGMLSTGPRPRQTVLGAVAKVLRVKVPADTTQGSSGGPRLQAVRSAAYFPLASLAPSPAVLLGGEGRQTLAGAFDQASSSRLAWGLFAYNKAAAAVTLRARPGSPQLADEPVPRDGLVTVRVSYLFHCAVPIASRILCRAGYDLAGMGEVVAELAALKRGFSLSRLPEMARKLQELRRKLAARRKQTGEIAQELSRVESPGLQVPLLLGPRFSLLQAEASLPNQGAGYYATK